MSLKIGSMNVRGLTDAKKRKDVFNWLKEKRYAIYCLQDIHVGENNLKQFEEDWGSKIITSIQSSESRGVAILFDKNLDYKVMEVEEIERGNSLIIQIEIYELKFHLCVIYGPNIDSPNFYINLKNKLLQKDNIPVVICGDWNVVMDYKLDTFGYLKENNKKARKEIINMIEVLDLVDTWRSENNTSKKFTWVSGKRPVKMARLDFFLVTPDIHASINNYMNISGYRSDHSLIGIELCTKKTERGKGFWKFNSALLKEREYVSLVKNEIRNVVRDLSYGLDSCTETTSKQMLLEVLKLRIRGVTIPYCAKRKKKLRENEANIESKIQLLERSLIDDKEKDKIFEKIQELKKDLQTIREVKLKGNLLRARAQKYVDFEKPTKYFFNLEKQNYTNKVVNKVRTNNGIVSEQQSILKELENFYKNLLQSKHKENHNQRDNPFLDKRNIKKLSSFEQSKCEGLITEKEVLNVLKGMKNCKFPGTDGYTAEFYKFFWSDIGKFVLDSLNESFTSGELSITQKQGLITLLPKGNKPRELLKNWRPITLLNVDYKLLSGVLASRIKEVLPNIIQSEQKGFLKDRYIGENIRTVSDSLEFIKRKKITGMLLLIDFEKAFDSLEWDYLETVLREYNFGPDL